MYSVNNDYNVLMISILAGLFYGLFYLSLLRYSIFRKHEKKVKFNYLQENLFNYLDRHLTENAFDIKYILFPIIVYFSNVVNYIKLLLIINIFYFIVYSLKSFYLASRLLNIKKISSSAKTKFTD